VKLDSWLLFSHFCASCRELIEDYKLIEQTIDNNNVRSKSLEWPLELIEPLSGLLFKLLEKGALISLERLQLLSCALTLGENSGAPKKSELVRKKAGEYRLVVVSGEHIVSEGLKASMEICFAERGARKFLRPKIAEGFGEGRAVGAISLDEVRAFLRPLVRDNRFFYDQRIAQLNGMPFMPVPSEMLMAELIKYARSNFGEGIRGYAFTFWQAIPIGAELTLAIKREGECGRLLLSSKQGQMVELSCERP
jgi:hypothetical protein